MSNGCCGTMKFSIKSSCQPATVGHWKNRWRKDSSVSGRPDFVQKKQCLVPLLPKCDVRVFIPKIFKHEHTVPIGTGTIPAFYYSGEFSITYIFNTGYSEKGGYCSLFAQVKTIFLFLDERWANFLCWFFDVQGGVETSASTVRFIVRYPTVLKKIQCPAQISVAKDREIQAKTDI